jgi:phospholipid transport system substrate-binding protein
MMRGPGVTVLVVAMAFGTAAWAGEPTDQLKGSVDQVLQILRDPVLLTDGKSGERRIAIRKVAGGIFAFSETARLVLGRHWQNLSEKERAEFVPLFSDLLERSYVGQIEQYGDAHIKYVGESVEGEAATVRTKLIAKNDTEVPVDYRLLRQSDRWLVYDVSIEGMSVVGNYRTQFNKIIQTASYEELVKRIRAQSN